MFETRRVAAVAGLLTICSPGCGTLFGPDRDDQIWISATALHLVVGDTMRLGVTMEREGRIQQRPQISAASPLPDDIVVEFRSSSPAVAEVDATGLVSAREPGTAVVWVHVGMMRDSGTVVVTGVEGSPEPEFDSISVAGAHTCGGETDGCRRTPKFPHS